jgi:cytochrome c556
MAPMSNAPTTRLSRRVTTIRAVFLACLLGLVPQTAPAQLRPLVRDMLDNLSAVERIAEGVALEDWDRIEDAARELRARAAMMRLLDLETLDMDRVKDPAWDGFLVNQERSARAISDAVRNEDARAVLQSMKELETVACLGCHAVFRESESRLRRPVLFMTRFLSTWRDINRGMVIRDFELAGLRARELATLSQALGTDEILEEEFGLGGPRQRRQFREFLAVVTDSAGAVEAASESRDLMKILESSQVMWTDGCVACHDKFRR